LQFSSFFIFFDTLMSYCVNARLVLARENGSCGLQFYVYFSADLKAKKASHPGQAHLSLESAELKDCYMQVGHPG
jgi:hypothetical protein